MSAHLHSWRHVLRHFEVILGHPIEVKVAGFDASERIAMQIQPGEWVDGKGGYWWLVLDAQHIAVFAAVEVTPELRESLTYLYRLGITRSDGKETPTVHQFVRDIAARPSDALVRMVTSTPDVSTVVPVLNLGYPGRFLWIDCPTESLASAETRLLKETVADVLSAYLKQSPMWEITMGNGNISFLCFAPLRTLIQRAKESLTEAEDVPTDLEALMQVGRDIVEVIAQDAFADALVLISRGVRHSGDVAAALASAVLLRRMKDELAVRVYGWHPLRQLIAAVPSDLAAFFRDAAGKAAGNMLPDDLVATLDGIVASNLNVSEAARALYLHRNSMNHRLERLKTQTGYDVRHFFDAAILWCMYQMDNLSSNG